MAPAQPLIVHEKGDVSIFSEIRDAESYLEAVGVAKGLYEVFDSRGRQLHLGIRVVERRFLGLLRTRVELVVIGGADDSPAHASRLRRVLIDFIERSAPNFGAESSSLPRLVAKAERLCLERMSRLERWFRSRKRAT